MDPSGEVGTTSAETRVERAASNGRTVKIDLANMLVYVCIGRRRLGVKRSKE